MPHALTERQKEYLNYIREYIRENETSPSLNEISQHFSVKPPTAHKILEALQIKGFIYFIRSSGSGFFIRLVERGGMQEVVMHVPIFGKVDRLGELINFPEDLGGFADFFFGAQPETIFALYLTEDIPIARMRAGDMLVFDRSKQPQPDDICIVPIGQRLFLAKIVSRTIDRRVQSLDVSIRYPVPAGLIEAPMDQFLYYYPLTYDESTSEQFSAIAEEQKWPMAPLPPNLIVTTALHLWRALVKN